jgi:hypothetical protein
MTALLGIGGLARRRRDRQPAFPIKGGKFHPAGIIMSIIGSLILLYAYLHFAVRRAKRRRLGQGSRQGAIPYTRSAAGPRICSRNSR